MVVRADGTDALRFVGRRDDVIKVSGENVSLTEVEATLARPASSNAPCSAAGPGPRHGAGRLRRPPRPEHPPAVSELAAWSERNLAAAARPRDWHLIEALPRTSVGKVRRFKLDRIGDREIKPVIPNGPVRPVRARRALGLPYAAVGDSGAGPPDRDG